MALYYYDKHELNSTVTGYENESGFSYAGDTSGTTYGYFSWAFDANSGLYAYGSEGYPSENNPVHTNSSPTLIYRWAYVDGVNWPYFINTCDEIIEYSKGAYIETIIAEDGTYPANGYQDGYWWVKGALAINMPVKVGGVWKSYANGFVKVSGVWKQINAVYVKVGGVWKT